MIKNVCCSSRGPTFGSDMTAACKLQLQSTDNHLLTSAHITHTHTHTHTLGGYGNFKVFLKECYFVMLKIKGIEAWESAAGGLQS